MKILHYLLAVAFMVLNSCAGQQEKKGRINEASQQPQSKAEPELKLKGKTENPLKSSNFSEEALKDRAIQKLEDYCESIGLISDADYPDNFRHHATTLTKELFFTDAVLAAPFCSLTDTLVTVNQYVLDLADNSIKTEVALGQVRFEGEFVQDGDQKKRGKIFFFPLIHCSGNKISQPIKLWEANVIAIQYNKKFGSETDQVWQVLLGKIAPATAVSELLP